MDGALRLVIHIYLFGKGSISIADRVDFVVVDCEWQIIDRVLAYRKET